MNVKVVASALSFLAILAITALIIRDWSAIHSPPVPPDTAEEVELLSVKRDGNSAFRIYRTRAPGGWLYITRQYNAVSSTFVPEKQP